MMSWAFKWQHFCYFWKCLNKTPYIVYINLKNNHIKAKLESFPGHSGGWGNCSGKQGLSCEPLFCVSGAGWEDQGGESPALQSHPDNSWEEAEPVVCNPLPNWWEKSKTLRKEFPFPTLFRYFHIILPNVGHIVSILSCSVYRNGLTWMS